MAKKKKRKKLSQITKARWLPTENTRPQRFVDRKKQASKNECRKGNYDY